MKKILLTITSLVVTLLTMAQSPNLMNYQGVARNAVGNVIPNQLIGLRLSILTGTSNGSAVYSETRTVFTNAFGLFNVVLGSPGTLSQTGTIAGINWTGFPSGGANKYLQVEIDPNGGSNFTNVGSTQLVSVPYAINASAAAPVGPAGGDLTGSYPNPQILIPLIKTQNVPNTPMISMTNLSTSGTTGALFGSSASLDANGVAIQGTMTSTIPGAGSSAVRGTHAGTGANGTGVTGTQAGSGWGVYGFTPSGRGVNGESTSGIGVAGSSSSNAGVFGTSNTNNAGYFFNSNAANTNPTVNITTTGTGDAVNALTTGTGKAGTFTVNNFASTSPSIDASSNGLATSSTINAVNTGLGRAGFFQIVNQSSTNSAIEAITNGTGASWGIRATSTGSNGAGLFTINNSFSTANSIQINNNGLGRSASFNSTNTSSPASSVDINTTGTGVALRVNSTNAAPKALLTIGGVQLTGLGEANNRILTSDATGNALWKAASAVNIVSGTGTVNFLPKWTPNTSTIGNSLLFDDGLFVGVGTTTPDFRLTVAHTGGTGIKVTSPVGFSAIDINAGSGDAALRFGNSGVNQWNFRNRPGDNYLEIFELGIGSRVVVQKGTGNVGIGQTISPAYRLDVQHAGGTGIRSQSTSSFSVVDIDAQSGDAALRFQKAGVGMWNTRNRPADDYYEIFELGGGGSRMVIQDGTGFVGIGGPGATASPSYQLDVENGGATGIRSRSNNSFSVVDIDAASGDAALRFQNAGVNQWNMRNRPSDNYLEIFELGGGGSRMVIQDGTGNVGIGQTTAPAYRLDVQHGGATGIRSQSTSTFSVVDIDAQNGDAALRFQKAGAGQWNTRNNPATDDYQIFELGGGGERMRIENTTGKVVVNGDFTVLGVKAFTMDHPLDPENKLLMHVAAESNEVINFYSGNITTDASGKATVSLPDYFEAINKDFRYQLTVVGGTFAQAIISKEVSNNKFEIATNQPNVKVSWEVKGVRNDARMKMSPFVSEQLKTPAQKGKYFDPASHNMPESKGVSYDANLSSSLKDVNLPVVKAPATVNTAGTSLADLPTTNKATKVADKTGSVVDLPVAKQIVKPVDVSGSVAPESKKEQTKSKTKPTE